MRISRALALGGLNSRRKCEDYVTKGLVTVNGKTIKNLATQVDIDRDSITYRGKLLVYESYIYYLLNKPRGFTVTAYDRHAKKTVYELLPRKLTARSKGVSPDRKRVFPVGRLDRDSRGLLLFTNDGELANKMIHPRYGIEKIYEVRLNRALEPKDKKKILAGIRLKEGIAKVQRVVPISRRVVHVFIKEGKKREIRRIFDSLDYGVVDLCRIAFGPFRLSQLKEGEGYYLSPKQVKKLRDSL